MYNSEFDIVKSFCRSCGLDFFVQVIESGSKGCVNIHCRKNADFYVETSERKGGKYVCSDHAKELIEQELSQKVSCPAGSFEDPGLEPKGNSLIPAFREEGLPLKSSMEVESLLDCREWEGELLLAKDREEVKN